MVQCQWKDSHGTQGPGAHLAWYGNDAAGMEGTGSGILDVPGGYCKSVYDCGTQGIVMGNRAVHSAVMAHHEPVSP